MRNRTIAFIVLWIITLLVPVSLTLIGVRILMSPAFLQIEYNQPGFPEDTYGFTKQDRLYWSKIAMEYLLNQEGISFLGDLRFEDGQPVYNERELKHMLDVKNVVKAAILIMYISLLILIGCGIWARHTGWWIDYRFSLARGGWFTVVLFAAIILFVMVGFDIFFVSFHNVFFAPGTWLFLFSDTLIRLFPERFWQTAFVFVGAFTLLAGLIVGLLFRIKSRN
ncbi:MAG: TIGR01906 family membrane protein [Chloroflexi bacterium]|nr:TIGR01906 family membrane protein [Chloroflexota bacterium]